MQVKKSYLNKNICVLLLILIAGVVVMGFYGHYSNYYVSSQINLFLLINGKLSVFSGFWSNITILGDALILLPLLSFLIFKNIQVWAALFGAIPLAVILSSLGKLFFSIPRPAVIIDNNQFTITGDVIAGYTSLPSGHTITIFAITTAILCVLIYQKKKYHQILWVSILMLLASTIAISRVAVGAHWPADLLLGSIFGIFAGLNGAFFTIKYNSWWVWMTRQRFRYVHIIILLILSLMMLVQYHQLIVVWLSLAVVGFVLIRLLMLLTKHT